MMNTEIKAKWLEALRSGKYKQAQRALCELNADGSKSYCCLGVLCDIVAPEDWAGPEKMQMSDGSHYFIRHLSHTQMPASMIHTQASLHGGAADKLAQMNDEEQLSFAEIADWIEVNL
jgi:hypothetical protein